MVASAISYAQSHSLYRRSHNNGDHSLHINSVTLRSWQRSIGSAFLVTFVGYIVYIVINTFISSNTSRDVLIKTGIAFIVWLYLVKKCYYNVDWVEAFFAAIFITIFMFLPIIFLPMFFSI
jgi:hypothetical protein